MQLDRALEGYTLFPNVLVLARNHAVVYDFLAVLDGGLLVLKTWHSCTKWVHLIALADLEAERSHLI